MAIGNVIICGAGPSGLLLGLLLAKKGIKVQLLDAGIGPDRNPRASHYAAPAVWELHRSGIMEDVKAKAFYPDGVSWRKEDGSYVAGIKNVVMPDDKKMVCLPLDQLIPILAEHLLRQPSAEILWGHKVTKVAQDDGKAWAEVTTTDGQEQKIEGTYLVGCDGATSIVRRSLFGDSFPGRTWDEQIVATNVYYDGIPDHWEDSNFIISPDKCHMVAKIQHDGLMRITYVETPGLTREEYEKRQPARFEEFLPGHPKPHQYKVVNFSPYKIHQRLAEKMRVGRILLAADAAHLCNPFGGMGLTGGIADVGSLYDALYGIHTEQVDPDFILNKYDEVRQHIYKTIVDPVSTGNLKRLLLDPTDEAIDNDPFYQMCKRAQHDEAFAKEMQLGIMSLQHDFTQYYNKSMPQVEKIDSKAMNDLPNGVVVTYGEA